MNEFLPDTPHASNPNKDFIRRIRLIEGDITEQDGIEAIATCMDTTLSLSRSLNRSIVHRAGHALDDTILETIYHTRVGDVYVLPGYGLSVKHILIAITPEWRVGIEGEDRDLLRCYRSIMEMADRMNLKSLAIPAMGTGKNKFPVPRTARLALQALQGGLQTGLGLSEARRRQQVLDQQLEQQEKQQQFGVALKSAWGTGDNKAMVDLIASNPDQAESIQKMIGIRDQQP